MVGAVFHRTPLPLYFKNSPIPHWARGVNLFQKPRTSPALPDTHLHARCRDERNICHTGAHHAPCRNSICSFSDIIINMAMYSSPILVRQGNKKHKTARYYASLPQRPNSGHAWIYPLGGKCKMKVDRFLHQCTVYKPVRGSFQLSLFTQVMQLILKDLDLF